MVILDKDEACGDTGATDDMHPYYKAFVSYRRLHGKYVILDDNTRIIIEGIGTVLYEINGKVIQTINALHIPFLQNPLVSLCRHRHRPGSSV